MDKIWNRSLGVLFKKINGKYYVFFKHQLIELNWSAAKFLSLCDGTHSVEEICTMISNESGIDIAIISEDAKRTFSRFEELKIIEQ